MEKIKIYLQYPWKISDSQYYKNIIEYPPKGIEYFSNKEKAGMIINKKKLKLANFVKRIARSTAEKYGLVILNLHHTQTNKSYDLIHCAHCLSANDGPWVADFEAVWQMYISGQRKKSAKKKALEILKKENCKKILAWTEDAKKQIIKKFPEIKEKLEIVPFAMPFPKFKKIKSKKIRLLFVGRYFWKKGGLHALESFDRLTKKYKNVEAILVTQAPKEIKKKYSKNNKLKFYDLVPYGVMTNKIFPSSDIYVCPGYSDTFGFPFVEALAFGLPTITVNNFARKELIENKKTGFIIPNGGNINPNKIGKKEEEIIQKIVYYTSKLIRDKKLREKMSKNGIEIVKKGKFSIQERNKKLKKIYREALK